MSSLTLYQHTKSWKYEKTLGLVHSEQSFRNVKALMASASTTGDGSDNEEVIRDDDDDDEPSSTDE